METVMRVIIRGGNGFQFETKPISSAEIGNFLSAVLDPAAFGTDGFTVEVRAAY